MGRLPELKPVRGENRKALTQLAKTQQIQAELAYKLSKRLAKRVAILVAEIMKIIQSPGQQFDGPRVALLNKLLDKLLPEVALDQTGKAGPHAPALQIVVQNVDRGRVREARRVAPQATNTVPDGVFTSPYEHETTVEGVFVSDPNSTAGHAETV